jgi:transcription antitermination factor NusG
VSSTPKSIDLWHDISWFAIHTKTRREKFAATNISALGIEIVLPLVKVGRLTRVRTQEGAKPLFPGYFFAKFSPEISCESVKSTRGVLRVVSSGRCPIPVGDAVVQEIRDRIAEDGLIRLRLRSLAPGTRVSIQDGPFEGLAARVERELDEGRRVTILLETLMQARVVIERRWLEAEAA